MNNRIKAILGIANAKNFLLTATLRGFLLFVAFKEVLFLISLYKKREFYFALYTNTIYYIIFISIAILALALYFAIVLPVINVRKAVKTLTFLRKYGKEIKLTKILKGWLLTQTWWLILNSSNFFDRALITKKIEVNIKGKRFLFLLSKYSYKELKLPFFQEDEIKEIIKKNIFDMPPFFGEI